MQIKRNRFVKKIFPRKFRYFSYFGRSKKKQKSREFLKIFCAINCCNYNTDGFRGIFFVSQKCFLRNFTKTIFAKFGIVFALFRLIYFREKIRNFTKKFVKYEQKISFFCENVRSLETLSSFKSFNLGFELKKNVIWKSLNLAGKWVW